MEVQVRRRRRSRTAGLQVGGLTGGSRGGDQCGYGQHDGGDQCSAAVLLQTRCTAGASDGSFCGDGQIQTLVCYYRSSY